MKSMIIFLACLAASLSVQADPQLLKARGYIDVVGGKLVTPAEIVVNEGMIQSVNADTPPTDVEVIDLGDRILLPGLMDMHVHLDLDFDQADFGVVTTESGSDGALRGAKNAQATLMAGFTTVRNVGQIHPTLDLIDVALSHAADAGWIKGPRIVPAGHMISILGGHGDLAMAQGLSEGMLELGPEYGVVSGVDDAIRATRFQIKHGAKTIKIHATAGVMSLEDSVGAQQLSDAEMRAIVEEAQRHEIPVAAHAHGTAGIKAAIRAGVDSIEHGSILDDEAMEMMVEHGTVLVPTSALMQLVPMDRLDPVKRRKAEYVLPLADASLRAAIEAGVTVAIGTDAPLVPHGRNALEIFAMMDHGMSAVQALQAATVVPAKLIRADRLGQLEAGWHADIIAVDDNPLDNMRTLEDVRFVMKGGVVYKSE